MTQFERSKREHCPACDAVEMRNHVLVQAGEDVEVYVECVACGAFVARYTLRAYTCEDPYRSYLRLMRSRRMSSGAAARSAGEDFARDLWRNFERVKELARTREESRSVEDLLDEVE